MQFRQPDGINCVSRRVCLAITAKLSENRVVQCNLWIVDVNRCVHVGLCLCLITFVDYFIYKRIFVKKCAMHHEINRFRHQQG